MDRSQLERLYLVEHLTMAEIGKIYGVSRQMINYFMRRLGVPRGTGERFMVPCDACGGQYSITRKRFKSSIKHFCSMMCYTSYLHNAEYRQSRTGQRIGRKVMEKYLNRELRQGEVIHHIDGDTMNNNLSNLKLFPSHSEHIAFHHKQRQNALTPT